jgi:hypothetical protein
MLINLGTAGHWIKFVIFVLTMILYIWSLLSPFVLTMRSNNPPTTINGNSSSSSRKYEYQSIGGVADQTNRQF